MLTIVIPAYNEADNIPPLFERVHGALTSANIVYEIILVDDYSSDKTIEVATKLAETYPVRVVKRDKGLKKGKASSLLHGFTLAKSDIVTMIDADLQYPPEAIPEMYAKIVNGEADVVIANRTERHTPFIRKVASNIFKTVFAKILLGFHHDVQSGLKVFRKEIVERTTIKPGKWMFDLEFLTAATHGGYVVDSVDITFDKRLHGKAKISLVSASIEMAWSAIRLSLTSPKPILFHANQAKKLGLGFHYKGAQFVSHNDLPYQQTAFHRTNTRQLLIMAGLIGVFIGGLILNWHDTAVILVGALTIVYFIDFLFNFFLIYRSFAKAPEIVVKDEEIAAVKEWPMYSIFCPLYKEWQVLPQFVTAMSKMDYPQDKLQIMLLLEEDDQETIDHAKAYNLPSNYEIVVVPHSFPKTKPKASNYGLTKAKGEFVVIYDAEDVPDPMQLKKALIAFEKAGKKTICIQAKLNFYNPHHNVLTRLFTAEYSLWFDLVLTGLQSIKAPIPLGGTSNHFRVADLKMLNGWDSFNVTEDCDLGIRLVKRGYTTAIVESTTQEEANSDLMNWYNQRSRWIKGYIQTYLVHMRNPLDFGTAREPHAITFQLVVGGKILALFINPFMWLLTITYFALRSIVGPAIESFYPAPIFYMAAFSLVFGNFLYMYYYMIGCAKREQYELIKYALMVPLYWLIMSIASWKALYEIFVRPHYWSKTKHGLHLGNAKATKQTEKMLGRNIVDEDLTHGDNPKPSSEVKKHKKRKIFKNSPNRTLAPSF